MRWSDREAADGVVVALLGVGEGQAGVAGTDQLGTLLARLGTGASLPTVTARPTCDVRYPPFWSAGRALTIASVGTQIRLLCMAMSPGFAE